MLQLRSSALEGCLEFAFKDVTGTYNSVTNTGGYGEENGVEAPGDFTSYTLEVWFPGSAIDGDPDYTYNLLTSVPAPDSDGYYSWTITAAMLGVDVIESGLYTMTATAVLAPETYITDTQCIFVYDVKTQVIDPAMLNYDPSCGCKSGCTDPAELFSMYQTISCGGICDGDKAQEVIDYLYTQKGCC